MIVDAASLATESDVEQKLLWPLLTSASPSGLSFHPSEIRTKQNIRGLEIGKGLTKKNYYPDYILTIGGIPVIVVEAKAPTEDVFAALDEARMYASQLNSLYPSGYNPVIRVVATNGLRLVSCPSDSQEVDVDLQLNEFDPAVPKFDKLHQLISRASVEQVVAKLVAPKKQKFTRAVSLVGGQSVRNEQIPQNSFGATLAVEFGGLFNPTRAEDRTLVAKYAYVPSVRRQRYVDPIERLIRSYTPPDLRTIPAIADSGQPTEFAAAFRDLRSLEHKTILLVGSVGSGKSTFIDYLTEVALPRELMAKTLWVRVNLNNAPLSVDLAYDWVADQLCEKLRETKPGLDWEKLETLEKIHAPELRAMKRGPWANLPADSMEFRTRVADFLARRVEDKVESAKAHARFVLGDGTRLLVICLDNCDKRSKDEQLRMFQVAQWVQREFRGLVFLPLRDVTYDAHKHEPPLDTAIKDLSYRIEPPRFIDVLVKRLELALNELKSDKKRRLTFSLPNGMKVPSGDLAIYLTSILTSLWAHDQMVRRILTGLAGRDVRRAMEIFLDFCRSGHIGEDHFFKMKALDGKYALPFHVVARVLLRLSRRFYDGDNSYIKNVFQCEPDDPRPNHFVRIAILRFLEGQRKKQGPSGTEGFHSVASVLSGLAVYGLPSQRVREEIRYLLRAGCIVSEHLGVDALDDVDLVSLSPAGSVHLLMLASRDYLAACAEDTLVSDAQVAEFIRSRIADRGPRQHYSSATMRANAQDFVRYLAEKEKEHSRFSEPLGGQLVEKLVGLSSMADAVSAPIDLATPRLFVGNLPATVTAAELTSFLAARGHHAIVNVLDGKRVAFLEFADRVAASKAADSLDGVEMHGFALRFEEAVSSPKGDRASIAGDRYCFFNVPMDADAPGLAKYFEDQGMKTLKVSVAGRKELAFVSFAERPDLDALRAMLGSVPFQGRTLRVERARSHSQNDIRR